MLSALGVWPAGQFTAIDRVFIDTGGTCCVVSIGVLARRTAHCN